MKLTPRASATYIAHLFKALTRQDHLSLVPVLAPQIGTDGVVIDVGGHAGQFTKLFSKIAKDGEVYVFEPGSYARSILERVIRFKGLGNVHLEPLALGDSPTTLTFNVPVKRSGSIGFGLSHFGKGEENRNYMVEEVQQTTLDDFVVDKDLTNITFIKADIEGWEGRMLAGAAKTLRRFKPTLYLELNDAHLSRANDTVASVWAMLREIGYEGWEFDEESGGLTKTATEATRNVFFICPDDGA